MKKLFALLLALVMLLALAACGKTEETPKVEDTQPIQETETTKIEGEIDLQGLATITVTVVHKDGTSKEFTYTTNEEFLGPLLQAEGLIEGNAGPYGMEITKVDGEQAIYDTDKAYWALYEGAEYALQGIDTTPIVDGATYKLEYTGA